ncbi:protein kinase, putative [Plasmodium malariae]|uniref:Protein kinase, putative n=1 Tax=Plasmodium malariae TaxID=5858 RepID=A0A1C3KC08_PLAMA|nr:protein kinase, putative [Plasmodium malariae]
MKNNSNTNVDNVVRKITDASCSTDVNSNTKSSTNVSCTTTTGNKSTNTNNNNKSTNNSNNNKEKGNKLENLKESQLETIRTEHENNKNNGNIQETHADPSIKLKSNPEKIEAGEDQVNKNVCLFISDDLKLRKHNQVVNDFLKTLSKNSFNLYFPKFSNSYNEVPKVLFLLSGDTGDILVALKYLIDNIDQINFIILNFLNKLKRRKIVKNNEVILYLIDFVLKKLYESNLNYRYKKTQILDFYDNLVHTKKTFFESGIMNDAIVVKDLRLIYFYKHDIKMKKEKTFIKERPPHNNTVYINKEYQHDGTKNSVKQNFVITNGNYGLNYKFVEKKKKKKNFCGEILTPNSYFGLYNYLKEKTIFDNKDSDIFSSKKKLFCNINKCIKKYIKDKRKCSKIESDICNCISNVIVNINSDAKLWEKINAAKNEVKNVKSILMKIKKIENLVDRLIEHDYENIIVHEEDVQQEHQQGESEKESIKTCYFENFNFNFVLLGSIKKGSDRHKSLLFKVLCDALVIPCRFVRYIKEKHVKYFNLVLIPSVPEKKIPESIIPIFWEGKPKAKTNLNAQTKVTISTFLNSIKIKFKYIDNFFLKVWENSNEVINLDDYFIFNKKLGTGGFGEVWDVSLKNEEKYHDSFFFFSVKHTSNFALKIMDINDFNLNESVVMREKAHKNVLRMYCVFKGYQILINRQRKEEKKVSLCFLLELADTSLEKLFCSKNVAYNLNFVRLTLLEIANVMSFMHKPNIKQEFFIYRDLKPDNILIKGKEILITDFNLSKKVNQEFKYLMSQCCGTQGHLAPEQKSVGYSQTVDIWAFAIVISKFLKHKNFHYFSHNEYTINLKHFEIQDKFLINLLLACIDNIPFMRPSFDEISQMLLNEIIRNELERYGRLKTMKRYVKKKR